MSVPGSSDDFVMPADLLKVADGLSNVLGDVTGILTVSRPPIFPVHPEYPDADCCFFVAFWKQLCQRLPALQEQISPLVKELRAARRHMSENVPSCAGLTRASATEMAISIIHLVLDACLPAVSDTETGGETSSESRDEWFARSCGRLQAIPPINLKELEAAVQGECRFAACYRISAAAKKRHKRRMSVADADRRARELADKKGAEFYEISERGQAQMIGCAWATWSRTNFFRTAQSKRRGPRSRRGRRQTNSVATTTLTREMEAALGHGRIDEVAQAVIDREDPELVELILDQCNDLKAEKRSRRTERSR